MLRKLIFILLTLLISSTCFAKEKGESPFYIQDGQLGPHYIYASEIEPELSIYGGTCKLKFVVNILLNDAGKEEMRKSFPSIDLEPKAVFMYCYIELPKEGEKYNGLLHVSYWDCYFEDTNGKRKIGTGRERDEQRDIRPHQGCTVSDSPTHCGPNGASASQGR